MVPVSWIPTKAVAAILGITPRGLDHLRVRGYLHPVRFRHRNFYDPQEVHALDKNSWPYRHHYRTPEEKRRMENAAAYIRTKRYRDERDPRPFPDHWLPSGEAARFAGYSRTGLWSQWKRGAIVGKKWRAKMWYDPLTLDPDCATMGRGGAER